VQRETDGYSVEIRDLKYDAIGQNSRVVEAEINLDSASRVTLAHLDWQNQPARINRFPFFSVPSVLNLFFLLCALCAPISVSSVLNPFPSS